MEELKTAGAIFDQLENIRRKQMYLNVVSMTHMEMVLDGKLCLDRDEMTGRHSLLLEMEKEFDDVMKSFDHILLGGKVKCKNIENN